MEKNQTYTQQNQSLLSGMKKISMAQSEVVQRFQALHMASMKAGALDAATKELMALACGIVSQCEGCIANHMASALRAGASKEAVFETISVAIMMGGGRALAYAVKAVEAYEEFAK